MVTVELKLDLDAARWEEVLLQYDGGSLSERAQAALEAGLRDGGVSEFTRVQSVRIG